MSYIHKLFVTGHVGGQNNGDDCATEVLIHRRFHALGEEIVARLEENFEGERRMHVLVHVNVIVLQRRL